MVRDRAVTIIGRAERVNLPTLGLKGVPAKLEIIDNELHCVFFGKGSPFYTGETVTFKNKDIDLTRIANSFGHKELRYKVKIPMEIKKRTIKATITLTDRSTKLYPILIGRSMLKGKFIVDVSRGTPLHEEEDVRQKRLKRQMRRIKKELNL
jgi:hypothetical protein